VPLDVVRATVIGGAAAPTDLRHFGVDVRAVVGCPNPERLLSVLDGTVMPSPARTVDVVAGGIVLRVDRRSVAAQLAGQVLEQRVPALNTVPVTTRLQSGAKAVRAAGRGTGFVLADGKLWPLRRPEVAAANDSPVTEISPQQWDAYPMGFPLGR
jgi:hypothetical protein